MIVMNMTALPRFALSALLGLLAACQTFTDGNEQLYQQGNQQLREGQQQARSKVVPPPSVQAALLPPLELGGQASVGPRFDVAAKDMPAREFFLSLMDGAGKNLVVSPQIQGNITFSLRNVTLEEVLTAVRDSYGYDFRKTSYGYQILPNQPVTQTYDLNYLNIQREGSTETRVSSGEVTNSNSTDSTANETTTSSSSSTLSASRLTTTSNVDFWGEVRKVVEMIIGEEPGNSVVANPQAGLLVVRANSHDQLNVEAFLRMAQRNLQRQVILETKIIEVDLNDQFQAGVNWTYISGQKAFGIGSFVTSAAGLNSPTNPISGPTDIGGTFTGSFDFGNFEGVIQLLETQGEVRVLSSPRISTLNNQKAVIKVGTDEFFVTDVSTTTTTLAGGTTAPDLDITLTPFFSGISLDVTPQIDDHEDITLHVRPSVSRVQDQNKTITLGGEDNEFNLPLALSTTRQSDSIIRARSGQVVVIGGLLQNTNQNIDAKLPWLAELPLIGSAFKQQSKDLRKSELVILLRPQVVAEDTWVSEIQKSAAAFKELR